MTVKSKCSFPCWNSVCRRRIGKLPVGSHLTLLKFVTLYCSRRWQIIHRGWSLNLICFSFHGNSLIIKKNVQNTNMSSRIKKVGWSFNQIIVGKCLTILRGCKILYLVLWGQPSSKSTEQVADSQRSWNQKILIFFLINDSVIELISCFSPHRSTDWTNSGTNIHVPAVIDLGVLRKMYCISLVAWPS